jgi:hypothetical protein
VTLLDALLPRLPPAPKQARTVSFGNTAKPAAVIEREKAGQRDHWRTRDRRKTKG